MPNTGPSTAPSKPTAAQSDTPEEARGRRILSTAYVRIGPDGYLSIDLRDGRALVLSGVIMGRKDYCGRSPDGTNVCRGYADVAAARPGGGPSLNQLDLQPTSIAETGSGPGKQR